MASQNRSFHRHRRQFIARRPDSKLYASDSVETIRREADRSVAKWWRAKNIKKKGEKKIYLFPLSLSLRWLLPRSSAEEGHDRFASFREKPLYGRGHACISTRSLRTDRLENPNNFSRLNGFREIRIQDPLGLFRKLFPPSPPPISRSVNLFSDR